MGIRDVRNTYAELRHFKDEYEASRFRFAESNRRVGRYTLGLLCRWYPRPLRPAVDLAVRAMLDAPVLTAFDLTPAPRWVARALRAGLRARALFVRAFLPPRRRSRLTRDPGNRTYPGYPERYRPADLGA